MSVPKCRALAVLALVIFLLGSFTAFAATPSSGTLSPTSGPITFSGGPFFVANATGLSGSNVCGPQLCDDYTLTVNAPPEYQGQYSVKIETGWPLSTADFDMYILDSAGNAVTQSASSSDPEVVVLPPVNATYTIRIVPFAPLAQSYTTRISFYSAPMQPPPATGIAPRYQNYVPTGGLGADAGEPSVGVNWKSGNLLYKASLQTLRTSFDDSTSPARTNWQDVSAPTSVTSADTILFTDPETGRTFASELVSACSLMSYSDDDGDTWTPSQGCGIGSVADHQTIGGGRFATGTIGPLSSYAHSVYYCLQADAESNCAFSLDGGQTFGAAIPMYNLTECGNLHGHVKVSPKDGSVYVPNKHCFTSQGVIVSEDNGLSWQVRPVTDSIPNGFLVDPSVGLATDGTLYFGYSNGDGHPRISVSHDNGKTWGNDQDVGIAFNIQNSTFPEVVAGDPDRAAFAFLGSSTSGNYTDPLTFRGDWYLYVASTFDGGKTWITTNATPNDPVQRGSICNLGTTDCQTNAVLGKDRNLLDFMDASVDKEGRAVVAYPDGCIGACVIAGPNTYSSQATVARQSGGKRLFAAYDPVEPATPAAPYLTATRDTMTHLAWQAPDNGGSDITSYNIYRGTASGQETLFARIPPAKTTYDDLTAIGSTAYFYKVNAVNAIGQGKLSNEVSPAAGSSVAESPCTPPGVTVLTDASGDQLGSPANSQLDIQTVKISEPFTSAGVNRLVFEITANNLNPMPQPNGTWKVYFNTPDGVQRFVEMNTFSGTPVFNYGHVTILATGTHQNTKDGTADPASGYSVDGRITIVMDPAKIGLTAGNSISAVYSQTQLLVGATAGLLETVDTTGNGSYTLVGSYYCRPNNAPTAALTANPLGGEAPLTVTLDGSASSDPDIGDTITTYVFDFGDGSTIVTQSSPTVTHTYTTPSDYKATLKVRDSRGKVSDNTAVVTINVVAPNQPPNAALSASPTSGPAPLNVNLDASASSDPDAGDTIASYTFNYGDGSAAVTQSGPSSSHNYSAAGTYVASVTVTDSRGKASTNSAQVAITVQQPQPSNTAPTANLAATPTSGTVPLNVNFSGGGSSDPDQGDSIASYSFNFGDGSGIVTQSAPALSHTYNRAGTYTASLVVTDSHGKSSTNTASVSITANPQPPSTVSGSGFLDAAAKISFGLKVQSNLTGSVSYKDNANNVAFDTNMISWYWLSGNCATFSGAATLKSNGAAVTYTITACDNGSSGSTDTFSVQLTGGAAYQQSGTLRAGNIKITR